MPESPELVEKINAASLEVQEYIAALKAVNAKQHKRIAHLEAENVSLENRIAAIKEGKADPQIEKMTPLEVANRIAFLAEELGYTLVKKNA